ncbi:tyrosine-type recombinase/integrase [Candidatus Sumerlaeota bacterium]|nr:tyrosine-type recombinase/integrase [Candidatus Sumerlaeota bacterium]
MIRHVVDALQILAYTPDIEAKPMFHQAAALPAFHHAAPFRRIRPGKEVQKMSAKSFKIGSVSIRPLGKDAWQIRYRDTGTTRDVRRRLQGLSFRDAQAVAININSELMRGKGYLPGKPKVPELPTIAEGIAQAIESRNTVDSTRLDRAGRAKRFVLWLGENYPAVKFWNQIRPAMLQNYVVAAERRGLSYFSVRLDIAPVKLAWRYMADNHPEHVRPLPRVKLVSAPKQEIQCLEAAEVAALLDWLKLNAPDLHGMATVQALAGLRVLEAAALRACDVDLAAGTLTVTQTPTHKPKTRDSYRTLPLCAEAIEALRRTIETQRIIPAGGELFVNSDGGLWKRTALGHRWAKMLKRAARELEMPRLAEIPCRKLRAAFATMASRMGAPDRLLKAYMGHSAGDMLGGHYRRIDLAELRTVSGLLDGWRDHLGEAKTGNFLATAEN